MDIAVIETGLGGRLDSTNIIHPELSIITNIGWDHMNLLGDTLEKIAFEKAGIIKPGIPVVVGETAAETRAVFEQVAAENNAPLYFADQLRYVADWKMDHHALQVQVTRNGHDERIPYRLDLAGFYQTKNLVTVLEAVHQLQQRGFALPAATVQDALHQVKPADRPAWPLGYHSATSLCGIGRGPQ